MSISLSGKSLAKLELAHPDLAAIIKRTAALSDVDFTVLEVLRSLGRQRELVARGASQTMKSRHLAGPDGKSRAVDIAPLDGGQVSWAWPQYYRLAPFVKQAAKELGIPVEWGGDWRRFKDGPHWQLPWKDYP